MQIDAENSSPANLEEPLAMSPMQLDRGSNPGDVSISSRLLLYQRHLKYVISLIRKNSDNSNNNNTIEKYQL